MIPTIYLYNIIQLNSMTFTRSYNGSYHTFFHTISSDIIIKFHPLFPHMLRKFLTLFHTFPHMLRKFLTLFHTFPHMLRKFLTLFHTFPHMLRKIPHCMKYEKALVSSYYHIIMMYLKVLSCL